MARPAELADGTSPGGGAQLLPDSRIDEALERIWQTVRIGCVVQQPLLAIADDVRETCDAGCDNRKTRSHVLENLQR